MDQQFGPVQLLERGRKVAVSDKQKIHQQQGKSSLVLLAISEEERKKLIDQLVRQLEAHRFQGKYAWMLENMVFSPITQIMMKLTWDESWSKCYNALLSVLEENNIKLVQNEEQ